MTAIARNPREEAQALLPDGHVARVLEPSPPANADPAWYADDPTDPGGADGTVVTPTSDGARTWDDVADAQPELNDYVAEHWLGARRRLAPLPESFATTRDALHQLAFFAVAPKRYTATGKLGLRWTHGGYGTPFYATPDGDEQVRVDRGVLVVQTGSTVRTHAPTTISESADFLGIAYRQEWFPDFHDPLTPADPQAPLTIDRAAAGALGDWFGFATAVLERLRRTPGATGVGRVQLWPEHFDPAVELGDADKGQRASYGASPGDAEHPEPYLYVAAWGEIDRSDPYWNDHAFNGASLPYGSLLTADAPVALALDFLQRGHAQLTASRP